MYALLEYLIVALLTQYHTDYDLLQQTLLHLCTQLGLSENVYFLNPLASAP